MLPRLDVQRRNIDGRAIVFVIAVAQFAQLVGTRDGFAAQICAAFFCVLWCFSDFIQCFERGFDI